MTPKPTSPVTSTKSGRRDDSGEQRVGGKVLGSLSPLPTAECMNIAAALRSQPEPSLLGRETVREEMMAWLDEQIAHAASQQAQSYSMAGEYGQRQGERWHARQVALYETKLELASLSPLKE